MFTNPEPWPRHVQREFKLLTGIQFTQNLGKYLGFPMIQGRLKREHFEGLVDKSLVKTGNWATMFLSIAGRVTLARTVLNTMHVYLMPNFKLLASIIVHLEMFTSKFIWKDSHGKGIHLVNCNAMAKPVSMRGLNLRPLEKFNTALLGKLVRNLLHNSNKL